MSKALVTVEMNSQEAKLWAGMQKLITQQAGLQTGLKKTGTAAGTAGTKMQAAGKHGRTAFGAGAVSQIKAYAASFLGIGAAITQVIGLFNDMREARQEAAQQWGTAEGGLSELAQLAKTPEQFQALTKRARQVYGAGGGDSLEAAAKLVFQLESAGASQFEALFTELSSKRLVTDPAVMAKAAATLQTTMGKGETGSMRDLVSKAFGASLYSPATADALLEAAARSGSSAKALGITDEEVLAATAVVATGKGSAEMGGTYLAQMMRTLRQKGMFKGQGLRETIQQVQQMTSGMGEEEAKQWFGRAQGREAFDIMASNLQRYDAALAEVRSAQKEDRVAAQMGLAETDPAIYMAQRARIAKAQEELSTEALGTLANAADVVVSESMRAGRARGENEKYLWAEKRWQGIQRWWAGDEWFLEEAAPHLIENPTTREEVDSLVRGVAHERAVAQAESRGQFSRIEDRDSFVAATENLNNAAQAIRDGNRGPTLVPPNVDR